MFARVDCFVTLTVRVASFLIRFYEAETNVAIVYDRASRRGWKQEKVGDTKPARSLLSRYGT